MSVTFATVLIVSAALFAIGLAAILSRTNIVGILMGIELILNASALNVVGFSYFHGQPIQGQILAIFIIVLAASEATIAFGILMNFYRSFNSVDINTAERMKD